jgi:hypothetical protein
VWLLPEDSSSTRLCLVNRFRPQNPRRFWGRLAFTRQSLKDKRSHTAVNVGEQYADGKATEAERASAQADAEIAAHAPIGDPVAHLLVDTLPYLAASAGSSGAAYAFAYASAVAPYSAVMTVGEADVALKRPLLREKQWQATLLRDIFGNPFRPVTFSLSWRTDTALALARQMYESRDFSAMPILADALQDAGCDSTDILGHCRGPDPHVRGCWVVDLVLGKE